MIKTIRDALDRGARTIYLNNGTQIVHLDHGQTYDAVCPPKKIGGTYRYRWIFCRIIGNRGLEYEDILYGMDKYQGKDRLCFTTDDAIFGFDFILSERDMNRYISLCGGIDEYRTGYWCNGWD